MHGIGQGTAIYIRDRRMGAHLFIVLTNPDPLSGRVVIVPIVTERPHTDKTVCLLPADHPFIQHRSNVDYGSARYAFASALSAALVAGEAYLEANVDAAVLKRVRIGLLTSSHTINDIAAFARAAFTDEG